MPSIFSNSIINKSNVSLFHMQCLSSLHLLPLLKLFQGREEDFCGHTARMRAHFHAASWKPGMGCHASIARPNSREWKSLSKDVRWKLLKPNKLSHDFSRNIFKNPFTNSSFFFFFLFFLFFHIMFLSISCYTTLYWKDSTLIQIFWGPAFLLWEKKNVASFPVSPLKKQ